MAQYDSIRIVDDYAHHPTEIRALLRASESLGCRRTIAVFQPHRYTRTQFLREEFGNAFQEADLVIVTDIYSAGEQPIEGVTADLIVQALQRNGKDAIFLRQLDDVVDYLKGKIMPGDLVMTIGAGNVWTVGHNLTKALEISLGETGPGTASRCRWQGAGQGDEKVHYLADRRHCRPVAVDLQKYLNRLGARIKGTGLNVIRIDGVSKNGREITCRVIPDREHLHVVRSHHRGGRPDQKHHS